MISQSVNVKEHTAIKKKYLLANKRQELIFL